MGGATAKRKDHTIQLAKENIEELGKYGEPIGEKICGVQADSIMLSTRLHQWHIEKQNRSSGSPQSARPERAQRARTDAFAAKPPWSSVNNCTVI